MTIIKLAVNFAFGLEGKRFKMAATKTIGCWRCGTILSVVYLVLICSSNANQNNKVVYPIQNRPSRVYTYENWKDWHKWQAPQEITDSFPLYQSGYDMEGLPGGYILMSLVNHSLLLNLCFILDFNLIVIYF